MTKYDKIMDFLEANPWILRVIRRLLASKIKELR